MEWVIRALSALNANLFQISTDYNLPSKFCMERLYPGLSSILNKPAYVSQKKPKFIHIMSSGQIPN